MRSDVLMARKLPGAISISLPSPRVQFVEPGMSARCYAYHRVGVHVGWPILSTAGVLSLKLRFWEHVLLPEIMAATFHLREESR